ncbi:MAG: hypothetical protein A3A33_01540 [Candidatus Yanofskybacteria bacterium RIFCSPLOWO2_01_FULL_49_25]|uniref:Glycosyltransferase 2-like domain-containing protein n=1 Tax=Candidatus Yanofskybacteria bacterium RIFCSPLOWO2_01_FULL_49_25 TaxID=1802701 RepID=A0A1F8GX56_9BACT|nr:MAG: hypothetical protein A3A33_01540 [Candidatus Yanofskybacteria bacterium RIFCSPLOWO2_01_FULL_49_25]
MPTISVIMPTHNRPELLKRAITSVLAQTYSDFELIVVDDGLQKSARETVEYFRDPRIIYLKHEQERGGGAARNTGIKAARGKFIAFLDDDDQWHPEKLRIQLDALSNTDETVGLSFTAASLRFPDRERISIVAEGIGNYFDFALGHFNGFLNVTLMFKREVLDAVGFYDERLPSHQETDLVLRTLKRYRAVGIVRPLTIVDMSDNRERIGSKLSRRIAGRLIILSRYLDDYQKHPTVLASQYFSLALLYRDNGQFAEAKRYFRLARKTHMAIRYVFHEMSVFFGGWPYSAIRGN